MSKRDKKSTNEKVFLEYLYKHGLKLPDKTQFNIKDIYVNVDFYYDPQTVIFIDGSVHDQQRVMEEDSEKRSALAAAGYTVLVWNYRTKIEEFIKANSWCFPKIKD
jgi:very-short-patch-repair endonuclease